LGLGRGAGAHAGGASGVQGWFAALDDAMLMGGAGAHNGPYYCAGLLVAAAECGDNGAVARLAATRKDEVNRANEVIRGGKA
jgi:hypothetical protein